MRTIRINFTDFWHPDTEEAIKAENPLYRMLSTRYQLEFSDTPDFLVYSCFGSAFVRHNCVRIFYTGENVRPNYDECDYALSFDYPVDERNYRLPHYGIYRGFESVTRPKDVEEILQAKTGFCSFVYSNVNATERNQFFQELSKYKRMDSGGGALNNIGYRVDDKLAFMKSYRFAIAFENSCYPGYTTEKILHAFQANAIPIYWGNPLVYRDFNPKAFINCHDYDSFDAVIDQVKRIDADEALYRQIIAEPCFVDNRLNQFVEPENILARFEAIFQAQGIVPVAQTRRGRWSAFKRRKYVRGTLYRTKKLFRTGRL